MEAKDRKSSVFAVSTVNDGQGWRLTRDQKAAVRKICRMLHFLCSHGLGGIKSSDTTGFILANPSESAHKSFGTRRKLPAVSRILFRQHDKT